MKKQLIVVVHGVGVREAGISTDLLATALDDDPPLMQDKAGVGRTATASDKSIPWRPQSSDDFHLRELPKYGTNHKRSIFQARIRRYRHYDRADPTKILNERVVADFYWGDISATGKEVLALIIGFFKIVLGLSHAVRENARSVFDGTGPRDGLWRKLASWAVLTIHGPIFAINIVLVLGLLVAWIQRFVLNKLADPAVQLANSKVQVVTLTEGQTLVFGAIMVVLCLLAGRWLIRRGDAYLVRTLGGWLAAVGLVLAIFVAVDGKSHYKALFHADDLLRSLNCAWVPEAQLGAGRVEGTNEVFRNCITDYQGPILYGMRLQGLMVTLWGFVIVAAIVLGLASAARKKPEQGTMPASFVMPALGLMMLLWFIVFAALWASVLKLPLDWNMNPNHINSALRGVGPAVVAVVLMILLALRLHYRKLSELGRLSQPAAYLDAPQQYAERHRLLIGRWLLWALDAFVVVVFLLSLDGLLRGSGLGHILPVNIPEFLQLYAGWFISGLAVVAALVLGYARNAFALGIAIFTDVLVYINDYSWNTAAAEDEKNGSYRPIWFERIPGVTSARKLDPDTPHGYWPRQRIQDRLKVLMAQLIEDEAPDEIVIVSHSQGTVIAMDVIDAEAKSWLALLPQTDNLDLVTMGSPYTHIYATYFPASFRPHRTRANLNTFDAGGCLTSWHNIFRVDDFVGTFIDGSHHAPNGVWPDRQWPREHPVPSNGHTMYWTDQAVADILRPLLEAT